jgi:RHS repeat-associated protein
VAFRAEYSAFGEATVLAGSGWLAVGFAGGLYDAETGVVRFGARDYEPTTGRWVSKDPTGFAGDGPGLYLYVHGDPVNFIDAEGEIGAAVAIIGWAFGFGAGVGVGAYFWGWPGLMPGKGPNWHHQRNQNQDGLCPPRDPTGDQCSSDWDRFSSFAPFHGGGIDVRGLGAFAGVQCIYDQNGTQVTDPRLEGSFDYAPPQEDVSGHLERDVWPWVLYGP